MHVFIACKSFHVIVYIENRNVQKYHNLIWVNSLAGKLVLFSQHLQLYFCQTKQLFMMIYFILASKYDKTNVRSVSLMGQAMQQQRNQQRQMGRITINFKSLKHFFRRFKLLNKLSLYLNSK